MITEEKGMPPIRILQFVAQMDRAGLETMLMTYYRRMDRERIQFDFLKHREELGDYDEEIISLGGKIYHIPAITPQNFPGYLKALDHFFTEHPDYRVVHAHLDALSSFVLRAAKKAGVPVRIAHSHNNGFEKSWKRPLRLVAKELLPRYATHYWGCSQEALCFLFGKDPEDIHPRRVLPNAIEPERFVFDPVVRHKIRQEMMLEDHFVLGHIGRFCYQKNQAFLLEIFTEIKKRQSNAVLLMIGDGKTREILLERARRLRVEDSVRMMGVRADIPRLLQGMDLFLLPSRFEGLGIVLLEAQMAGLRCLVSDRVSQTGNLTGQVVYWPLERSPADWAKKALELASRGRTAVCREVFQEAGYDIVSAARSLEEEYMRLWRDGS